MPPSVQADDAGLKAAAAGLRPTTPEKRASRPTNRCEAAAQRHPLRFYGLPPRTGSISPTRAEGIDASRQPALTASDWQGGARRARNRPVTGAAPASEPPRSPQARRRPGARCSYAASVCPIAAGTPTPASSSSSPRSPASPAHPRMSTSTFPEASESLAVVNASTAESAESPLKTWVTTTSAISGRAARSSIASSISVLKRKHPRS